MSPETDLMGGDDQSPAVPLNANSAETPDGPRLGAKENGCFDCLSFLARPFDPPPTGRGHRPCASDLRLFSRLRSPVTYQRHLHVISAALKRWEAMQWLTIATLVSATVLLRGGYIVWFDRVLASRRRLAKFVKIVGLISLSAASFTLVGAPLIDGLNQAISTRFEANLAAFDALKKTASAIENELAVEAASDALPRPGTSCAACLNKRIAITFTWRTLDRSVATLPTSRRTGKRSRLLLPHLPLYACLTGRCPQNLSRLSFEASARGPPSSGCGPRIGSSRPSRRVPLAP